MSALICTKVRDDFGILSVSIVSTVRKAISSSLHIRRNARLLRRSGMTSVSSNDYSSLQILNCIMFESLNLIDFSFLNSSDQNTENLDSYGLHSVPYYIAMSQSNETGGSPLVPLKRPTRMSAFA